MVVLRRKDVRLRSHHLKIIGNMLKTGSPETYGGEKDDIIGYHGLKFWQNLEDLYYRKLRKNPKISIVRGLDDICQKCPHRKHRLGCQDKSSAKESAFLVLHNLETGKSYQAEEVFKKLLLEEHVIRDYFGSNNHSKPLSRSGAR